jgi:hypothetical protein
MLFKQPIRQSKPMRPLRFSASAENRCSPVNTGRRNGAGACQKQRSALVAEQEAHDLLAATFRMKVARLLAGEVLQGVPSTTANIR